MLQPYPLLGLLAVPLLAHAFSFKVGDAVQCQQLQLSWSGGTPPYHALIIPTEDGEHRRLLNFPIPDDAQSSYTFIGLPIEGDAQFLVTMSDATGFGTGGTSELITVKSSSDNGCYQTGTLSFSFYVDPNEGWNTCDTLKLATLRKNSSSRYSYWGFVPESVPFNIANLTDNSATPEYQVDLPSGTQLMIAVFAEEESTTGGSSNLLTIGSGSDTSCVRSVTPSPTDKGTATPSNTGGGGSNSESGSSSISGGAIAGIVIGVVAGLAILAALLFFFLRRRKREQSRADSGGRVMHDGRHEAIDGNDGGPSPTAGPGAEIQPFPFVAPPSMSERERRSSWAATSTSGGLPEGTVVSGKSRYAPGSSSASQGPVRYHEDAGPIPFVIANQDEAEDMTDVPPAYREEFQRRKTLRDATRSPPPAAAPTD